MLRFISSRYFSSIVQDNAGNATKLTSHSPTHLQHTLATRLDLLHQQLALQASHLPPKVSHLYLNYVRDTLALYTRNLEQRLMTRSELEQGIHTLQAQCRDTLHAHHTRSAKYAQSLAQVYERQHAQLQQLIDQLTLAVAGVKSDVQVHVHYYKADSRDATQRLEGEVQEQGNKLTVRMSELRTDMETVKVRAIFSFTVAVGIVFGMLAIENMVAGNRTMDEVGTNAPTEK